jgi:hypothetical protein
MILPDFHDGFFDGFYVAGNKSMCLFLRTQRERRYTLLLEGVEALKIAGVRQGNIILDISLLTAEQLTVSLMEELYEIPPGEGADEKLAKLLDSANRAGLQCLELSPSYGAECIALFKKVEIEENHRWPT